LSTYENLIAHLLFVTFAVANSLRSSEHISPATDTSASAGSSTPIPIGIAFAQTSNVLLLGQEVVGAKIAEVFNHKGGINGT